MKITVDTNVLISATFWYGDSFRILERVENKEIELILSHEIIKEYEEVLAYNEIQEKIQAKQLTMKQTIQKIQTMATLVYPIEKVNVVKDDPDDNAILECALEGKVDFVITSDKHLLKLQEFKGMKILTPAEFRSISR